MIWEWVIAHFYFGVGSLNIVGFERRATYQASIGNNPQAPDIYLIGMAVVCMIYVNATLLYSISGAI